MNAHTKPPGEAQDALYLPTDTTPEQLFQAIGRLRKEARDEIHRLIVFLDTTDDYVSRELEDAVDDSPCDDNELEPSLCGTTAAAANMPSDFRGDDREGDAREDDEDGHDREPSLGSCNIFESQTQAWWGYGGTDEREGPEDDLEPSLCGMTADVRMAGDDRDLEGDDSDREPSLGWTIDGAPGNWDDRELQNHVGPRPGKMLAARQRFNGRICNVRPIPGAEWRVS